MDNEDEDNKEGNHDNPIGTQGHQYEEEVIDEEIHGVKHDSDIEAAGVRKQVKSEVKGKVKAAAAGGGAVVYLLSSDEEEWPET